MSASKIRCTNPDCARSLRVPDAALGHRIRCPACKQEIRIPGTIQELRKLADQKHCRLHVVKGPAFVGSDHVLESDRAYTFGRSDDCNVQLPGPTVSKRHFSMHWVNSEWVLEDLNTTTGTQVDGLGVTKKALRGGEIVEIGAYQLQFLRPGTPIHAARAAAAVVVPSGKAEPLPVSAPAEPDEVLGDVEQRLRDARSFTDFEARHLESVGKDSARRYSLSLATRLLGVAALIVVGTVLSLYGKSWFGRGSSLEPADAVPGANVRVEEPLPVAFEDAIEQRDIELAATLLKTWEAGGTHSVDLRRRMSDRLESEIRYEHEHLLQRARNAMQNDDWDQVDAALAAAQAPALGPLTHEWDGVKNARRQQDHLARAQGYRDEERWTDALAEIQAAENIDHWNPRITELKDVLRAEAGGGLLVNVASPAEGVQISVDGDDAGAAGREQWHLPPGTVTLSVTAPGHFAYEETIDLRAGQLTVLSVELAPQAPDEAWALLALRHVEEVAPLWLAAKYYGDTDALPAAITQSIVEQSQEQTERELGRTSLRVAKITLTSGEEFTARVWSEMSSGLTVQAYPAGKTRAIRAEDIGELVELDFEEAADEVLAWITLQREDGLTTLETLEESGEAAPGAGGPGGAGCAHVWTADRRMPPAD